MQNPQCNVWTEDKSAHGRTFWMYVLGVSDPPVTRRLERVEANEGKKCGGVGPNAAHMQYMKSPCRMSLFYVRMAMVMSMKREREGSNVMVKFQPSARDRVARSGDFRRGLFIPCPSQLQVKPSHCQCGCLLRVRLKSFDKEEGRIWSDGIRDQANGLSMVVKDSCHVASLSLRWTGCTVVQLYSFTVD